MTCVMSCFTICRARVLLCSACAYTETSVRRSVGATALIVLFTDGLDAKQDNTFANRDQHPVEQQMWGMVLSERHFGNPLSSIDYVVAHWRNDTVEPTTCFAQAQSMRIGAVDQYDWRQQLAAARQRLAAAQTLH